MKRLSIALRKGLPLGLAMNVCGHLAFGMAGLLDAEMVSARDFRPKDSAFPIATLSDHPLIVLQADSDEVLSALYSKARAEPEVVARLFGDIFFTGSVEQQMTGIASVALGELAIAGVALFGDKAVVSKLTRSLPLYD